MQILDEDVAQAGTSDGGFTLAPHDSAWLTLDGSEVHGVERAHSVGDLVVVDVIAADADGGHRVDGIEDFKKQAFEVVG